MRRVLLLLLLLAARADVALAQDRDGGPGALLARLERALLGEDAAALGGVLSLHAAPAVTQTFLPRIRAFPARRLVIRERDRDPLDGTWPGDGYRLTVEILQEGVRTARILTARLDVRRARGDQDRLAWRLAGAQVVAVVEGLHRLQPNADTHFSVRHLAVESEDLRIEFAEGTAVPVDSDAGMTGLIVFGAGQVTFQPRPPAEQDQVRLFSGDATLRAPLEVAFLRFNPGDIVERGLAAGLSIRAPDEALTRRARAIFDGDAPRSFRLELGDLSRDLWFVVPSSGDLLAELHTRGRGHLTYARVANEPEDISLIERARGIDIARYASRATVERRGETYDEDALDDIQALDYDLDVTIDPPRETLDARARLRVRVQAASVGTISLRLAEPLEVRSAYSPELGPLVHLRVSGRDSLVLNLPAPLARGAEFTLEMAYGGRLRSQTVEEEAGQQGSFAPVPVALEPYYLLSTRSYWYPQPESSGYATATIRVTLPAAFTPVVTGGLLPGFRAAVSGRGRQLRVWAFEAGEPVRYLALLVARLRASEPLSLPAAGGEPALAVERLASVGISGRQMDQFGAWTVDILDFYRSIMGDLPYPRLTVAAVERPLPGGHSPPGAAILFHTPPSLPVSWRDDPAAFEQFPEFFLAHELAHQWWGHGVGWANYHEQWLSEGFAQYFAALYAEHRHGPEGLERMLRQFRRWTLEASDQGPVSLGYRLGQISGDRRVRRALVYNKAAGVLHTLRRLVGDDAFFGGLRLLYRSRRFAKADTADVQAAFEAASGRPLGRFFDQWIRGAHLPRVRVATRQEGGEVVVRFEQLEGTFDLPVTVTLTFADGRTEETVVPVTEARVERRLPLAGPLRQVRVNRDSAALATFEGP